MHRCPAARRNALTKKPTPPITSAIAEHLLRRVLVPSPYVRESHDESATPSSEKGAEPISIHIASRAWTCPNCRCRTAPNDLKMAPWRMSVPIATVGLKPKTRISIGVISEPPPMPVMPTRRPTRRPATDSFQSTYSTPTPRPRAASP